ncbi:HAD family hydrolase [Persicirhabdus sediminis]|uniref:HAD family phosphatase n=1 Tax=Persicirhabdus sediminis TaxID=454144 RepID=A0A8J7MC96_9BACT|nr:HAD family phosphatase [Persicirhabdus sediminis]MBK1789830.1 HAD family phosphatase [Persicirhabdus sediminis]
MFKENLFDISLADYDAVIFDLDGTLVDSMPAHFEAWCVALDSFGAYNVFAEDVFYAMGGRPTRDIVRDLNGECDVHLDAEAVGAAKRKAFMGNLDRIKPITEVIEFAKHVRGKLPMAVATGGSRNVAEKTLKQVNISDLFDEVVTANDVKKGKPNPDIYFDVAERLGVKPERCLVFEDAPAGIEAALAAGMEVITVPSPLSVV